MKLGIMQPYFLPYIGYWQLIFAVDKFVIYDDVNFIKGGWINRNRLLENGNAAYFNVNMQGASPNKLICDIDKMCDEIKDAKLLKRIMACYKAAPYFEQVYPMMEKIIMCKEQNLSKYLASSIKEVCNYLQIDTTIVMSSDVDKDCSLRAQDKVIDICKRLGADSYYNAIGGQSLYDKETFQKEGIELRFIETENIVYAQYGNEFVPFLSIMDVLMFNGVDKVKEYLAMYKLV